MTRFRPRIGRALAIGLLTTSLGCLLALAFVREARAVSNGPPPAARALGTAANDTLGQAMKQMNDALKALGKPVNAENRDAALEELARFEAAVISAKAQTPDSAAKIEEKKRAAFVADYRKTLVEALKFACDAETAILDAKYKDADSLIRNKLGGLKSTGHGKFKTDGGK